MPGDFPCFAYSHDRGDGAFNDSNKRIVPGQVFRVPWVQTNHVRIKKHDCIVIHKIEQSQFQVMRLRKTAGGEVLIVENQSLQAGHSLNGLRSVMSELLVLFPDSNRHGNHASFPWADLEGFFGAWADKSAASPAASSRR